MKSVIISKTVGIGHPVQFFVGFQGNHGTTNGYNNWLLRETTQDMER